MFGLRLGRLGKIGDRAKTTPGVLRGGILGFGVLTGLLTVNHKLSGSLTGTGTLTGTLTVTGGGGGGGTGHPTYFILGF